MDPSVDTTETLTDDVERKRGYIRKDNGTIIESVTHYTPLPDGSRAWLHIYHDDEIGMHSKQASMRHYSECYDELHSGELVKAHKDFYKEFFELGYKTKNGQKIKAINKPETYLMSISSAIGASIPMLRRTPGLLFLSFSPDCMINPTT